MKKGKSFNYDFIPDFLMERFSNCLNSYTKSFNKVYDRKGSLFIDYLRRIEITEDAQFGATIFYIHKNPVHHGYCNNMDQWPWSSYSSYKNKTPTLEAPIEVLKWFGCKDGFLQYHSQPIYLKNAVIIEDL